ncbi:MULTISPECIES: hypothetical protein [unclassified Pseudomonas]|uniref:hypothetical protein n=1 Tax=unclassified Pseudomonas TaxID=196821 RepID=UPI001F563794|nr:MULTISPECIES: hypothetical protein [unclassified Pseudomonas]
MSLSVNNPSVAKVDASTLDRLLDLAAKPGETSNTHVTSASTSNLPARLDNTQFSSNGTMIPGAALNKLFEMLEQVFSVLREMLAGRDLVPSALSDSAKLLDGKPAMPSSAGKSDASEQPKLPGAAKQPSLPAEAGLPEKPELGKQPNFPGAGRLQGKLGAVKQQNLPAEAGLPVKPDVGKSQKSRDEDGLPGTQTSSHSVVTPDARMQRLTLAYPPVSQPDVSVNNDSNATVHVNVNVAHCHCPDERISPDNWTSMRQTSDLLPIPAKKRKHEITPGHEHAVRPREQPAVRLDRQPEVRPGHEHEVKPGKRPAVRLDKHPEVTPGHEHEIKPGKRPEVSQEKQPHVTPGHEHEVKPGKRPEVSQEKQPHVTPGHEHEVKPGKRPEVSQEKQPPVTPGHEHEIKSGKHPEAKPTPKPSVTPAPGLTSPAPDQDTVNTRNRPFNARAMARS